MEPSRNGFTLPHRVGAWFALWTAIGLAFAGQHYLTSAKVGIPVAWGNAITGALADWYLFGLLALPAAALARRFSLSGPHWRLRIALHVVAGTVFSLLWILARAILAQLLVPLRGTEKSFDELLRYVLVATFFFNMIVYWVVMTGTHALAYYQDFQERERRVLELESRLASARLHALRMQLNPHFLFNSLNGISTLMYRDVDAADAMLVKLAGLLRHALDQGDTPETSLRDELGFLDRYLDLEQMRFGNRLGVIREIDPKLLGARVPTLILQPLVENAIRHGIEPLTRPGTLTLRISSPEPGRIRMEVEDDGTGFNVTASGREGIGTSNTRHRLLQQYGTGARFDLTSRPGSGTRAVIEIPCEQP
jgi:two-component system LytT family sensor kinase